MKINRGFREQWTEEEMTEKELMIRNKINTLIQAIIQKGGENAVQDTKSVEELISKCARYIKTVINLEAARATSRCYLDDEEYRQHIEGLDKTRSLTHNSLIASVNLINRLCQLYGTEAVYTGSNDRVEIADFSFRVVEEYFASRKR